MRLKDHIAFDFLQKGEIAESVMNAYCAEELELLKDVDMTKYTVLGQDNKFKQAEIKTSFVWTLASLPLAIGKLPHTAYYITDTVMSKLKLLKLHKNETGYDWTIFKDLPECKKTFIFGTGELLRMAINQDLISFLLISGKQKPRTCIKWFSRLNNDSGAWAKQAMDDETIYKLLCFFYFSKNEEIIVKPGIKHGSRKAPGSLYNESDLPVVIVNNNWNVTSIRTEGFDVSGHFRLQPCGPGLKEKKLIFIDPFRKNGYIRKSTKS